MVNDVLDAVFFEEHGEVCFSSEFVALLTMTIIYVGVALAVLIAIIGAVIIVLMLRKK